MSYSEMSKRELMEEINALERRLIEAEEPGEVKMEELIRLTNSRVRELEAERDALKAPDAGIWMTNERYDFLIRRADIAEGRIRTASKELKTLCLGDIKNCGGRCPKQDSKPCEYHELWLAIRGGAEKP